MILVCLLTPRYLWPLDDVRWCDETVSLHGPSYEIISVLCRSSVDL